MKSYCLGFAFDEKLNFVTLICKNKPERQEGKLNGVGGKIERDELPVEAMEREFEEETGVNIPTADWGYIGTMYGDNWQVACFFTNTNRIFSARSIEDEMVYVISVDDLMANNTRHSLLPNVRWLLAMIVDRDNFFAFDVVY